MIIAGITIGTITAANIAKEIAKTIIKSSIEKRIKKKKAFDQILDKKNIPNLKEIERNTKTIEQNTKKSVAKNKSIKI